MRRHPHSSTENAAGISVAGDVEEPMFDAPSAANGEGDAVADGREL